MTCREKLKLEHPENVRKEYKGECYGCPAQYGYSDMPDYCVLGGDEDTWRRCWDREIPEAELSLSFVDKLVRLRSELVLGGFSAAEAHAIIITMMNSQYGIDGMKEARDE